jgi:hypothetical protein
MEFDNLSFLVPSGPIQGLLYFFMCWLKINFVYKIISQFRISVWLLVSKWVYESYRKAIDIYKCRCVRNDSINIQFFVVTELFALALAIKAKMQRQEIVWDRDVKFKCGLKEIIKICARNVGDGISDKVTCHRQLQIILISPCSRRQNKPPLQYPNCLHAKNSCLVNLPQLLPAFSKCIGIVRLKTKLLHCPSVCWHASARLSQDRLREMLYGRHMNLFRKI